MPNRSMARAIVLALVWGCSAPFEAGAHGPEVRPFDSPSEHRMQAGEEHEHAFFLDAGTYLRLEVVQSGVDVVVDVLGPAGEMLASFDSPTQNRGSEHVHAVAESTGEHTLLVRSVYRSGEVGSYLIERRALRPATLADRHRASYGKLEIEVAHFGRNGSSARERDRLPAIYPEMIDLARAVGDRRLEAVTWLRLANTYRGRGELHEALVVARVSLELWREIGDPGREASVDELIGAIYGELGEVRTAFDYLYRALEIGGRSNNPRWSAYTLLHLAHLHASLGHFGQAGEMLARSLAVFEAEGMSDMQAGTLLMMGRLHSEEGLTEEALGFFERVLVPAMASTRHEHEALARMEIAHLRAMLGQAYLADQEALRAWEKWSRRGEESYEALFRHTWPARIAAELGRLESALAGHRAALRIYRRLGESGKVAETLFALALLEMERGELDRALEAIEEAVDSVESHRHRIGTRRFRALFTASRHDYYELWIDLLMRAGRSVEAFEVHERSRARSLLEALDAEAGSAAEAGTRGATRAELREAAVLEEQIRAHTRPVGGSGSTASATPGSNGAALTDLLSRYSELQERIRERQIGAPGRSPRTLSFEQMRQSLLDDGTLILKYALGDQRSFVFMVTRNARLSFELPPRAELEDRARRLHGLLSARARRPQEDPRAHRVRVGLADAEYERAVNELGRLLLQPGPPLDGRILGPGPLFDVRRIVVMAEGALQYLPFAILPTPGDEATPLGFRFDLVSAPSASVVEALRRRRSQQETGLAPGKTLAVLADPALDPSHAGISPPAERGEPRAASSFAASALVRSLRTQGIEGLHPLPGARREARFLEKLVPEDERFVALGTDASLEAVLGGGLAEYRLLHFATHGLSNDRHPDLSGLVLALVDEEGQPRDGFLRRHTIESLELRAELVVLSACRTALGQEIRGDGIWGLDRGFLQAGASSVIASLWSPDDQATAALMESFYEGLLHRGLAPATALRRARATVASRPEWRSPYFWAPFVLQGDWRAALGNP